MKIRKSIAILGLTVLIAACGLGTNDEISAGDISRNDETLIQIPTQQYLQMNIPLSEVEMIRVQRELQGAFMGIQSFQTDELREFLNTQIDEFGVGELLNYGQQQVDYGTIYGAVGAPTIHIQHALSIYGELSLGLTRERYLQTLNDMIGSVEGGMRLRQRTGPGDWINILGDWKVIFKGWASGDLRITSVFTEGNVLIGAIEAHGEIVGRFSCEGLTLYDHALTEYFKGSDWYIGGSGTNYFENEFYYWPQEVYPADATAIITTLRNQTNLWYP